MKIDKQKLIELLVDKTGMDQPSVEEQLDQLIKRIIDAAERGKALEIKEFGLFYFDENGDLKFDPAKELSTEINFKYAGMEPVELKPPRDSAPEIEEEKEEPKPAKEKPADESGDLEDIFGLDSSDEDEPSTSKEDTEEPIDEPKSDTPIVSKADKVEREIDPFSGLLGDASTKMSKPADEPADEAKPGKKMEEIPDDTKKVEATTEKETTDIPDKPKKSTKPSSAKEKTKDPIMVVMSVVLVFVLVAAGFFIIPVLFQESEQPDQQVTEQVPEEVLQTDTPETLMPVEPAEESEVTEDVAEEVDEPEETEPEQPRYGLTGPLVDAANDGFSIVLHSLSSEERARAQASSLAADNYRVVVSPRVVNNNTVWRVSVGQFPTIEAAQEVARELPSPYNTNNFIQRIQTN